MQNAWKTFLVKLFKKIYYMVKKYTLPIGKGFGVSKIIFIRPILYRCCLQDYTVQAKCFELTVIRNTTNIVNAP